MRMIQDITLGQYMPVDSLIHRLDPRTKIIVLLAFIPAVFNSLDVYVLAFSLAFLFFVAMLASLSVFFVLRGIRFFFWLLLFTALFHLFFTPGDSGMLSELLKEFSQKPLGEEVKKEQINTLAAKFDWENIAGNSPNKLVLNIQPDEGISLSFGAKKPGPINQIKPVQMDFSYAETFGADPPEAYERLLLDCMNGDATLFTRSDEVLAAWEYVNNIVDAWRDHPIERLPEYQAGTWGPPEMEEFLKRDGRSWCELD